MPSLPRGWGRKVAIQAAPGALFGGDFLVSRRDGQHLQLALVDVSGKGDDVVSHAMLLSGTFSGLLGAVPPGEYLPACNTALMRSWDERLVTALHLHRQLPSSTPAAREAWQEAAQ